MVRPSTATGNSSHKTPIFIDLLVKYDLHIPVFINSCIFPILVCSHFVADSSVNAQILLKMTKSSDFSLSFN